VCSSDLVTLVDGRGGWFRASIVVPHHRNCSVEVLEHQTEYGKRPYRLHIGIAPTKNIDRFEWFVEKATEIGIDEITPLLCEHSERKHINADRLQRIMIAAMKQSKKAYLPQLNEMTDFGKWVESMTCIYRFIAYCGEGERLPLKIACQARQDAAIAIGPEGDFSMQEVTQAIALGFKTISLGASILRTETAGVAACVLCQLD
jgi:16S rRNA (uracil1498-N3)-methyltransferase